MKSRQTAAMRPAYSPDPGYPYLSERSGMAGLHLTRVWSNGVEEKLVFSPAAGEIIADGRVYAGISPTTGKAMYTTPKDCIDENPRALFPLSRLRLAWGDAVAYAKDCKEHDCEQWRLPSTDELHLLYLNRKEIGNFCEQPGFPDSNYWSSTPHNTYGAHGQEFAGGNRSPYFRHHLMNLRLVSD